MKIDLHTFYFCFDKGHFIFNTLKKTSIYFNQNQQYSKSFVFLKVFHTKKNTFFNIRKL